MFRNLFIIVLLVTVFGCNEKRSIAKDAVSATQTLLTQIVEYTKEKSLYRENVNWDTLSLSINQLAEGAESITELTPALKFMFKSLGDEHGQIFYNNNLIANYFGPVKEHQKDIKLEIYNEILSGQTYKFHAEILKNKIGYLRIVYLPTGDNNEMTQEIQNKVCDLMNKGVESWVLDLRYNNGGNLLPMVEGLASIIGDGHVGGAKGVTTEENMSWTIKNGDFFLGDESIALENDCKVKNDPKVAVLLSEYTASSGEALAIIFKGREHTKFFGQKTFGQVTGNFYEMLNDSIAINIAVNYFQDRNSIVYDKYVDVDQKVDFVKTPLSKSDNVVELAQAWLGEKN